MFLCLFKTSSAEELKFEKKVWQESQRNFLTFWEKMKNPNLTNVARDVFQVGNRLARTSKNVV
jgi:hypothetical protein